ncbi:MAG: hypothetical protein K0U15_06275, partial [Proteobacteria bacterium]|nr:hypothetical protein [Pseudomonadota bacterium]
KIADLAISGGFLEGDYAVNLHPANNANFAVDYNVGENTAVLNLTNDAITGATTLSVTVVLDDQHPATTPQTLAFTVTILSAISFVNDVGVSAAYRTELDNNIALLTLSVFGAEGNVTYGFVGTKPARYDLSPVSGDDTQIIVSLQAGVNNVGTSNLIIQAVDSSTNATAIITAKISSEHPQRETFALALRGEEYGTGGTTFIHHLYTGVIGSIRVSNPGKFSGLAEGSNYTPSATAFITANLNLEFRPKAGASEQSQEFEIYLTTAPGGHSPSPIDGRFRLQVNDDHNGNRAPPVSVFYFTIKNKFSLAITGISSTVNSDVGGALATIQIADNDGLEPYVYDIIDVNTDSLFSTQLSAALTVDTSNNGSTATLRFNADTEITENAKVTATVRIVDDINVTVYYGITLDVKAPFSLPALETITVQRTNTAGFYTPNHSGAGPYHYGLTIATNPNIPILVEPTDGELRLFNALGFNGTTTLGILVRDGPHVPNFPGPIIGTFSLVVEFIGVDDNLSFISSAATATIGSTDNSGIISGATAVWENGNIGVINYRLGATNPAAVAANFAVNESNGALMLASALGSLQTVSVEIIAYPDIVGVDDVTATIVVESIAPISFAGVNNPQAVTATTRIAHNNLFVVNADFIGDITYSVSDNRFSVNGNVLNLTSAINTAGEIALVVFASETILGDTATLIVTVNLVHPPVLNLSASNIRSNFFVTATAKVADLALSGGFVQEGYNVNLHPANAINDANFAVDYNVGDNTAVLNLTNTAITNETTLTATVVLDDTHPETPPQTLEFTVAILSLFGFADGDSGLIVVHRTELDYNIGIATLAVLGASGAVSYDFVNPPPTGYTLSTEGIDDKQIIISITSVVNGEATTDFVIEAVDASPSTATITVTIASQHPGAEQVEVAVPGGAYVLGKGHDVFKAATFTTRINHLYTGIIVSIRNSNAGDLSGLSVGGSYRATASAPHSAADFDIVAVDGVSENRAYGIYLPTAQGAGAQFLSIGIDDDHSANNVAANNVTVKSAIIRVVVVNSLSINVTSFSNEVQSTVDKVVATVTLAANTVVAFPYTTGVAPYSYEIVELNAPSALLSAQLSAAFAVDSSNDGFATVEFSAVATLADSAVIDLIVRATDAIGDSADFVLTVSIGAPLVLTDNLPTGFTLHNSEYNDVGLRQVNNVVAGGLSRKSQFANQPPIYNFVIASEETSFSDGDAVKGGLHIAEDRHAWSFFYPTNAPGEFTVTIVVLVTDFNQPPASVTYTVTGTFTDTTLTLTPTTISISADESGTIATVTAAWTGLNLGEINYSLESVNPSTPNLNINNDGVLVLASPLASGQQITAEIKAEANVITPDDPVEIEVITIVVIDSYSPVTFDINAHPQNITTSAPKDNLLVVNASDGSGNYSYSISDTRFSITNNIIALTANITSALLALQVVAEDLTNGDFATLFVTVQIVPPPLILTADNIRGAFFFNTAGQVAELTFAGGQAPYNINLSPANDNFAIDFTAGNTTAILSLTSTAINELTTLTVTVVLDDNHSSTEAKTRPFTVTVMPMFDFDASPPTVVYRTELDEKIDLITLTVANALGAVSYDFTGTPPAQYVLSPVSGDDTQIIISLTAAVNSEGTSDIVIEATDNNSTLPSAATITVTIASQHPQTEEMELYFRGENDSLVGNNAERVINHLYTGLILSIVNSNPGELSGLSANGGSYTNVTVYNETLVNENLDNVFVFVTDNAVAQNRVNYLNITVAAGIDIVGESEIISIRVSDDHNGNGLFNTREFILSIVASLSITSPAGANNEISNSDTPVATVALANTGLAPYTYSVVAVNSANNQLADAFSAFSIASSGDATGTLTFEAVSGLTDSAVVTAIVRATDTIGDSADFTLTLNVYTPLVAPTTENVTLHHTYTAGDFYTPEASNQISGGKVPYTYAID